MGKRLVTRGLMLAAIAALALAACGPKGGDTGAGGGAERENKGGALWRPVPGQRA